MINDGLVCNKHTVFASEDVNLLTEVVLIMDYCYVFISCLDSNSFFCNLIIYTPLVCVNKVNNLV